MGLELGFWAMGSVLLSPKFCIASNASLQGELLPPCSFSKSDHHIVVYQQEGGRLQLCTCCSWGIFAQKRPIFSPVRGFSTGESTYQ